MKRALFGIGFAIAVTAAAPPALARDDTSASRQAPASTHSEIRLVPSAPEPSADAPPRDEERARVAPASSAPRVHFALEIGGFDQRLIVLPVHGVDFGGSLGVDFGSARPVRGMFDMRLEAAYGATSDGLGTRTFRIAPEIGAVIVDRVRLGGGLQIANAGFWRRTTGDVVDNWLVGAGVFVRVDVVRFDGHAVFVALRGDYDVPLVSSPGSDTHVVDGALTIGFRY